MVGERLKHSAAEPQPKDDRILTTGGEAVAKNNSAFSNIPTTLGLIDLNEISEILPLGC